MNICGKFRNKDETENKQNSEHFMNIYRKFRNKKTEIKSAKKWNHNLIIQTEIKDDQV